MTCDAASRSPDGSLYRQESRLIYECSTGAGAPQFPGIYYRSRLGDQFENWAIFERPPTHPVSQVSSDGIDLAAPDLLQAVALLKLELAPQRVEGETMCKGPTPTDAA